MALVNDASVTDHPESFRITGAMVGLVAVGYAAGPGDVPVGTPVPEMAEIYHQIFPADTTLLGDVYISPERIAAAKWALSNGRSLSTQAALVSVQLPFGHSGLVGWCSFDQTLEANELVELICLIRGTPERIRAGSRSEYWLLDQDDSYHGSFRQAASKHFAHRFNLVPVVYIKSFTPSLSTVVELFETYSRELTSIRNLFINRTDLLKESLVRTSVSGDVHPFTDGATFFSPDCTLEVHTKTTERKAYRSVRTVEQQHSLEWNFLTGLLVLIVLARSSMEADSAELDTLLMEPRPRNFLKDLRALRNLSNRRRAIAMRLNIYTTIAIPRREYMATILDRVRPAFGLDNLYRAVRTKLDDLGNDINVVYTAYLTTATLLITIVAGVLTAITVYQGFIKP